MSDVPRFSGDHPQNPPYSGHHPTDDYENVDVNPNAQYHSVAGQKSNQDAKLSSNVTPDLNPNVQDRNLLGERSNLNNPVSGNLMKEVDIHEKNQGVSKSEETPVFTNTPQTNVDSFRQDRSELGEKPKVKNPFSVDLPKDDVTQGRSTVPQERTDPDINTDVTKGTPSYSQEYVDLNPTVQDRNVLGERVDLNNPVSGNVIQEDDLRERNQTKVAVTPGGNFNVEKTDINNPSIVTPEAVRHEQNLEEIRADPSKGPVAEKASEVAEGLRHLGAILGEKAVLAKDKVVGAFSGTPQESQQQARGQ